MKKQKVLIVHNYYQIPGGEDTVVENEKNLLLENGHEVLLYTRHNDEIKNKNIIGKLLLPLETIFSIKTYKEVKKIIKKEKIDIVHVHNTLPLVSPSVYYAAKKCKISVVQTIHNFRLLCPGATFTRDNKICEDCVEKSLLCSVKNKCYRGSVIQSLVSAFNLGFHRMIGTYKKVDGYIALTEFNKSKLKTLIEEEKIFVKPNFTYFEAIEMIEVKDRKYFLYLGRIDKLKGIDLILRAWEEIKDEELYIVGSGPYEETCKKYVLENKLDNVKFLGFRDKEEVQKILKYSKALIIPSQWYEGFPMTILESFALGIPVVGSDIGNISTIINNEVDGLLFKYNQPQDLKEKIYLLKNSNILKYISNNAKEAFDLKYNKKNNYMKLIKIYSVVGENNEKL